MEEIIWSYTTPYIDTTPYIELKKEHWRTDLQDIMAIVYKTYFRETQIASTIANFSLIFLFF